MEKIHRNTCFRTAIIVYCALFFWAQEWQDCLYGQQANPHTIQLDSTLSAELQTTLNEGLNALSLIGASVSVIVPGQGEWRGVSGMSDPLAGDTISAEMIFGTGSITKNFIAALILELAEEGLLTLEDSLGQWLPAYPNIAGGITIRQLLNHTSGIFNVTDSPLFYEAVFADLTRNWAPEEVISNFVHEPYFPPGTDQVYSNTNYILAGMIIKVATGSEVSTALRSRFWNPLNLGSTFLDVEEEITGEIAHGWEEFDNGLEDISPFPRTSINSAIWTAGAAYSTAGNLAWWGKALFEGEVLSTASLDQMLDFVPINEYGLGAFRTEMHGRELWGHNGGTIGYTSLMLYEPQDSICIAVMLNIGRESLPVAWSDMAILDALLGVVFEHTVTAIESPDDNLPAEFELQQNYPNPFNPSTNFGFRISNSQFVNIKIYDIQGRLVKTVVSRSMDAGNYTASWDGTSDAGEQVASGIYFYQLLVGDQQLGTAIQGINRSTNNVFVQTRKMMLLK